MQTIFPEQEERIFYLTEGGTETELMYKYGHELPEFAMYPMLDKPDAVSDLKDMYEKYLDTVAESGFAALMGGLDYRASPDWGKLQGLSSDGLKEMQHRSIEFLRTMARPYQKQISTILVAGVVGPRGDAYSLNKNISEEEAEDYHSVQLETLKDANVDFVWAATFNNVPEAVGLPLCISFTLNSSHCLGSGPTLKEAIMAADSRAGKDKPVCYGINCSHPLEFEPALESGTWIERIRNIRPNAVKMEKVSLCKLGHLEDGDPIELGEQLGILARRYPHIDMWGGCCGTWNRHLKEIAKNVLHAHDSDMK